MIFNRFLKQILFLILFVFQAIWANEIVNLECYDYLTELVRSSNFPFNNIPKEKNNLLIDSDENNIIFAQVNYDKKTLGISYDTNRMASNGWIKYYVILISYIMFPET